MNYKLPPQAIEAEKTILGAILFDPSITAETIAVLNPEDFYLEKHGHIFAGVQKLYSESVSIDALTLEEAIRKNGKLSEAGGKEYIRQISAEAFTSTNFQEHCKIIKDKSILRAVIKSCNSCTDAAYGHFSEPHEIIGEVQEKLLRAASDGIRHKAEDSRRVIGKVVERLDKIRKGERIGFVCGFEPIDSITMGFRPGDLNIIAGRPGWGKTAFAVWLMLQFESQNHKCLFMSLEMTSEDLGDRVVCNLSKIPNYLLSSPKLSQREYPKILNTIGLASKMSWKIDDQSVTFDEVAAAISRESQKGFNIVFVDYMQLVRHSGKDKIEQVSNVSNGLKRLAKRHKILIFALSQMNRDSETKKEKPQPHHLKGSGDIEQDASLIFFPWPIGRIKDDEPDKKFMLSIGKNRHGMVADIPLEVDLSINNFAEWNEGNDWQTE